MPDLRTKCFNADSAAISERSFAILNHVQDWPAEDQIMGAAAFFLILSERLDIPVPDLMGAVTNMMADNDRRRRPEWRAIDLYLREELNL